MDLTFFFKKKFWLSPKEIGVNISPTLKIDGSKFIVPKIPLNGVKSLGI